MKKFAIYLPQFHEIPENNEWWGKGFTEWVNVKQSMPLFKGHNQPKIPLNNNYYDLSDKKVMEWQNDLAANYGIDGFVFYHYYFNGKHLLNKPIENLLDNPNVDREFFFCWANHTWKKTWNGTNQILIEQTYGNQDDWLDHFNYLLRFFKDERYYKINNKPVFMIFKTDFPEYEQIFDFFDNQCRQNGFDGILVVESVHFLKDARNKVNHSFESRKYYREPAISTFLFQDRNKYSFWRIKNKISSVKVNLGFKAHVRQYSGDKLFDLMISYARDMSSQDIPGAFFEWDNTPRHKYRGYIITPPCREKFFEFMTAIKNHDLLIINAWNEWAEGMMLEPTENDGYKYLSWIKEF